MCTLMLAIKPEYLQRILDGTKKYEFRKRIPKEKVSKLVFYCTAPTQKIVAWADVLGVISAPPAEIWERTSEVAGISAEKYNEYFEGCERAYAYRLGNVCRFDAPKSLREFGLTAPPQSFAYVG